MNLVPEFEFYLYKPHGAVTNNHIFMIHCTKKSNMITIYYAIHIIQNFVMSA